MTKSNRFLGVGVRKYLDLVFQIHNMVHPRFMSDVWQACEEWGKGKKSRGERERERELNEGALSYRSQLVC